MSCGLEIWYGVRSAYEKNVRRAQRLAQLEAEEEKEEKEETPVVDAEVEPVKEEKPEE